MKAKLSFFAILLMLSTFSQVMSDLYLPSLPAIQQALATNASAVQSSVMVFTYALTLSPLFFGLLSDGIGRRKPLIIGITITLIGSVITVFATSIQLLIIGRILQGLGGGACLAVSRAILPDMYNKETIAKLSSYLAIGSIIFISSAPALGGLFQHFLGWRSSFIFLTLYAGLLLWLYSSRIPETNKHLNKENLKPAIIFSNIKQVLSNRSILVLGLCIGTTYGSILAWLTSGPITLHLYANIPPIIFGFAALSGGGVYIVGAIINGRLVTMVPMEKILTFGLCCNLAAGLIMLLLDLLGYHNLWVIVGPVYLLTLGISFVFPCAFALATQHFGKIGGITASALVIMQISGGAITSSIITFVTDKSQFPLAIIFIVCACISLICYQLSAVSKAK